jgi:hypothetical protein
MRASYCGQPGRSAGGTDLVLLVVCDGGGLAAPDHGRKLLVDAGHPQANTHVQAVVVGERMPGELHVRRTSPKSAAAARP